MAHKSEKLSWMKDVISQAEERGKVWQTGIVTTDTHSTIFHVRLPQAEYRAVLHEGSAMDGVQVDILTGHVFASEAISDKAAVAMGLFPIRG